MAIGPRAARSSEAVLKRPALFRLLAFGLGCLLVLCLEGLFWLLPTSDEAFRGVGVAEFTLFSREAESDGDYYRISHPYAYPERGVRFAVEKPAGSFRIFVLGASAAAGWPHPPEETFSSYLERGLASRSGRSIEVINAAAHGFPSYRVRTVFDEVLELSPDAIVLYCGNNEFLEHRRYGGLSILGGWLGRTQLVRRSRSLLGGRAELSGEELNELAASMWARVQRQATELRDDPKQYRAVQEHYAASLRAMARAAAERDVPLLLTTVPSNLRDWLPTVSRSPAPSVHGSWEASHRGGRAALLRGEFAEAAASLRRASELAPAHAETWFWLARAEEGTGRSEVARDAYRRARDEDRNPFRAIGPFQTTVRELAGRGGTTRLVDLERDLDGVAARVAPGFDLFLDYVHPTVAGNREIADRLGKELAALPRLDADWTLPPLSEDYREADDFHLHMKSLGMALINHQYQAAVGWARQVNALVRRSGGRPGTAVPEEVPPVVREALEILPQVLAAERRDLLGEPMATGEIQRLEASRRGFYDKWFRYGEF